MKKALFAVVSSLSLTLIARGQEARTEATAAHLQDACKNVYISSGIYDKKGMPKKTSDTSKTFALGECQGYIQGYLDGMEGTIYQNSDGSFHVVRVGDIKDEQDVIVAFMRYLAANPLAKNKTAGEVLIKVLLENNLIGSVPVKPALQTTQQ